MEFLWMLLAFFGGWVSWTLVEYLLHRFGMHGMGGKGPMSRRHLEHHAVPDWTSESERVLAWVGVLFIGIAGWMPLARLAGGTWLAAVSLVVGWGMGYFAYKFFHARSHLVPPRGPYSRRLCRHHFHHHFGHPRANYGISVTWWDRLFGTLEHPATVLVPRRMALSWLLDETGDLLPKFADDYRLVGSAADSERQAMFDRARDLAPVSPED